MAVEGRQTTVVAAAVVDQQAGRLQAVSNRGSLFGRASQRS